MNTASEVRTVRVPDHFSLGQTCGPVWWGGGRWPGSDWIDGTLLWAGWEDESPVWRSVTQQQSGAPLRIAGPADPSLDRAWIEACLGVGWERPTFSDPVLDALQRELPGLHPWSYGSLWEGLTSSITGQSVSIASAATAQRRIAQQFSDGMTVGGRTLWPTPRPDQVAAAPAAQLRESGITWRRAEALVAAAQAWLGNDAPTDAAARTDPAATRDWLRTLPLVGPWTAESTLLWGLGIPDAHPTGDVALLRAARQHLGQPDLTLKTLDQVANAWAPNRGWAARYLWTALLGAAPAQGRGGGL